jgi:hypothetical protein
MGRERQLNIRIKPSLIIKWGISILVVGAVTVNFDGLAAYIRGWGLPQWSLLRDYLQLLFSIPGAVIIIAITLMFKFPVAIQQLLRTANIQFGGLSVTRQETQQEIAAESHDQRLSIEDGPTSDADKIKASASGVGVDEIERYKEQAQNSDFRFLSLYLVPHTRAALLSLHTTGPSTRENLTSNLMKIPSTVTNVDGEKEAMFSALLSNGLIEEENAMYRVSAKGLRFLKFLKLI